MDLPPQPLLLTAEAQENVRKWIDTGWKVGTLLAVILGFWGKATFATKEGLQIERDVRVGQYYEILQQVAHLAEQKDTNARMEKAIADLQQQVRVIERATVWGGKPIDNRDLGHP